jgi:hypothetical protein
MVQLTQEALRRALEDKLALQGETMRSKIWTDMVNSRYVQAVQRGKMTPERLLELYLQKDENYFGPPVLRPEVVRVVEDDDARTRALAEMLARLLCGPCGVTAFREQVLGGRLLGIEEIVPWVCEQAGREGPVSAAYVAVPAPPGEPLGWTTSGEVTAYAQWLARRARAVADDPTSELPAGITSGPLTLEYGPLGRGAAVIEIRANGILACLKEIASGSNGLCLHTGWLERAAVAFVLGGLLPPRRYATVAARPGAYPAAAQITLTLSANLSVKEVTGLYRGARSAFRGAFERSMDKKHLALALFVDELRESGLGWQELHRLWNERHRGWRYTTSNDPQSRRFALEARRSWSRLSGADWHDLRDEHAGPRVREQ